LLKIHNAKNRQKFAIWAPSHNFVGLHLCNTCPHNMVNFGPLTAAEANQILHDVWPPPGLLHYIYIFGGCCPLTEFCQVQTLHYVQVLRSPILAALLHGTPPAGIDQTLQLGTRNGITELLQTAPPIFGWAAITLGIGPHSSCL